MSYPILFGNTSSSGAGSLLISGGTEIVSSGYKYHVFNSVGSASLTVTEGGPLEYLVVAGGGGGQSNRAGGGGAGGLVLSSSVITPGSYNIFVGQKGTKASADTQKRALPGSFSGISSSSSGYRYWRFVGGAGSLSSHFPNGSRIGFTTESGDTNIVVYNSDNCSDQGKIPGLSAPTDTITHDFGSKKVVTGMYYYSVYNGGYRVGQAQIFGSDDNSNWTLVDTLAIDNGVACGLQRFNLTKAPSNMLTFSHGGGHGAADGFGINGGSGGGGNIGVNGGTGISGQGNNGGNSTGTGSGGSGAGGGGGGFSTAGSNGNSSINGGNGGQGWSISSGWSSLSAFSGMSVLSSGGGGGAPFGTAGSGGTGAGNGGSGSSSSSVGNGSNATSFGSGGGGGAYGGGYSGGTGGDGYQGILIVRYPL